MTPLQRVLLLASRQHGAVSVPQMRDLGLSWAAQRAAVASGVLQMVPGHVVVVVGSPDSWRRALHVGQLALGPHAWVSHEAAAALLGLDRALTDRVEFTVRRGRHHSLDSVRVHTTMHVSPLERWFLRLMRQHRLPRPTTQYRVRGPNGLVGRVDFVYADLRVVVEVTGRKGHASDAERQCDAQRRNELTDEGFRVYEYTRGDVEDRPEWVAVTMRDRLTAETTTSVCDARSRPDAI